MKILYFAWVRQKIGLAEEIATPPTSVNTAGELIDWLVCLSPGHAEAFANRGTIRIAINQIFAEPEDSIVGVTEIAFFPPVTGG
jgi:molybdopterin synthase sulfur carrier subunit